MKNIYEYIARKIYIMWGVFFFFVFLNAFLDIFSIENRAIELKNEFTKKNSIQTSRHIHRMNFTHFSDFKIKYFSLFKIRFTWAEVQAQMILSKDPEAILDHDHCNKFHEAPQVIVRNLCLHRPSLQLTLVCSDTFAQKWK